MKFLNAYITDLAPERERFDTLISPSGTVATLNALARENGIDCVGFDSAYPHPKVVLEAIQDEIERTLSTDDEPVLLCTSLVYNSEATLRAIRAVKSQFGKRVRVVVGGQLVPFVDQAYRNNPDVDATCIGDAEAILPLIINDIQGGDTLKRDYRAWLSETPNRGQFAFQSYDEFFMLEERMAAQVEIAGFSQLCIQGLGGPGCSWAAGNKHGACDFCALQNITEMNTQPIEAQMRAEKDLQDSHSPDRLFDVANQFLPFVNPKQNANWLRNYIKMRKRYGVTTPKYAYLTVASITEEIAELMKEAGIVEVYLGVDHFDTEALKEENKSHRTQRRLEQTLDALKRNTIRVRMGLVVGSSRETSSTLQKLKDGVNWLGENYTEMINSLGVFPIYVLPGSKVYERVRRIPEAQSIITRFEQSGYFTLEDESELARIYMENHSEVDPDAIYEAIKQLQTAASRFTHSYDFRISPGPEVLKEFRSLGSDQKS